MQRTLLLLLFGLTCSQVNGQRVCPPPIQWQQTFGGSQDDRLSSIAQTSDGGFILGGYSESGANGNKTSPNYGGLDFWVVRIDANGTRLWDQTFGGSSYDELTSLKQTSDGGFVLGGFRSTGSGNSPDYWVIRLDSSGNKSWDVSFGGNGDDYLTSVTQTSNGGFILGGESTSGANANKTESSFGGFDFWIVRLDANGTIVWDRTFGGTNNDLLQSLEMTIDGGFIVGGFSSSPPSGNKTSSGFGLSDFWIIRLDAAGNKLWEQTYGGSDYDYLSSIKQTADGGYIAGGISSSANGLRSSASFGSQDFWILRLDSNGNMLWDRSFGGSGDDSLMSLSQTSDGGFIFGGQSSSASSGNKESDNFGRVDLWGVRVDQNGNKLWEQSYGGANYDSGGCVQQTQDGGFILAGSSESANGGNKTSGSFGAQDFWLLKLAPEPPKLHRVSQVADEMNRTGYRLILAGIPNLDYRTEYSTNLSDWLPLQTNRLQGSEVEIVDPGSTNSLKRFYRARLLGF